MKDQLKKEIIEQVKIQFKDIRISDIHECEFHLKQLEKFFDHTIDRVRGEAQARVREDCAKELKIADERLQRAEQHHKEKHEGNTDIC